MEPLEAGRAQSNAPLNTIGMYFMRLVDSMWNGIFTLFVDSECNVLVTFAASFTFYIQVEMR